MDNNNIPYRISNLIEKLRALQGSNNIPIISKNLNKLNKLFSYFMDSNPKNQNQINQFKKNLNQINARYQNEILQNYPNLPSPGKTPVFPSAGKHIPLPRAGTNVPNVKKGQALKNPILKKVLELTETFDNMQNSDLIKDPIKYNRGFPSAGRKPANYLVIKKDQLTRLNNIIKHHLNEIIYKGDLRKIQGPIVRDIILYCKTIEEILQNIRRGELEMKFNTNLNVTIKKVYLFNQITELVKNTTYFIKELSKLREKVI